MGEPLTGDGTGLAGYLAAAVRDHPDRIAVRERNRGVTYRELDAMTAALAARLHDAGAKPGDRVVVWLNKSIEAVAAIHGILRAGCAYVPIDPTSPPKRAAQLITRTTPVCVLTTPDREQVVRPELEPSAAHAFLSTQDILAQGAVSQSSEVAGEWPSPGPDDLAYILHTSGSTGTPKGVMLSHRNARAFVDWVRTEFQLRPDDVLASHAPLHFDLSILDVFAAAAAGACVTLVPESFQGMGPWLVRFVLEQRVSVWYSVPGALRRMADADREGRLAASRLRVVAFAGEVYHTAHLRTLRSLVPAAAALYNLYGPTETNVCTYHEITAEDLAADAEPTPPIGLPCPYAGILIRDGELWVGGASVMTGYWDDPAGTGERIGTPGAGTDRYYRTGDLVTQDSAGRLRYLGRSDSMVKLNGYRVELGEVEAILSRHPDVSEAACVVDGGTTLTAFVVPRAGADADPAALSRHCADYLPRHMVPRDIVRLAALPQTSTGKTDRRALTARAAEPSAEQSAEQSEKRFEKRSSEEQPSEEPSEGPSDGG